MKRNTIAQFLTIATLTALTVGIAPKAKADDKGCSNATLKGTFAFTSTGVVTAPPEIAGPVAEVGMQTFDGNGGTNGTATLSGNGTLYQLTITGTYTVNSDCTGSFTLQISPLGITVPVFFVIDDGGDEFRGIETGSGDVITRVGRRLFPGKAI